MSSIPTPSHLSTLPPELLTSVLSHLFTKDLVHASSVNHAIHDCADYLLRQRIRHIPELDGHAMVIECSPPSNRVRPLSPLLSSTGPSSDLLTCQCSSLRRPTTPANTPAHTPAPQPSPQTRPRRRSPQRQAPAASFRTLRRTRRRAPTLFSRLASSLRSCARAAFSPRALASLRACGLCLARRSFGCAGRGCWRGSSVQRGGWCGWMRGGIWGCG